MAKNDRYEIVRSLGQGGAGEVYLATDRTRGHRRVALKCLSATVDDRLRAAMAQEFGTMASLSAPGVGAVHDFGIGSPVPGQPAGPFFTREFVDGVPLDEAAAERTPLQRARLVADVAAVLAPLHRVGVVHGDLKPANVIVDAQGSCHLIDFGLSHVMNTRGSGPVGGTPAFMAPERLDGELPTVASDIYALGVMLYQQVAGALPEMWQDRAGITRRLAGEAVELPEGVSGPERMLLQVAVRAIAPDARDRYPNVEEFAVAVDGVAPDARGEHRRARTFVAPRPRGQHGLLSQLESALVDGLRPEATALAQPIVLRGADGSGRTTMLRELKWRLQLRELSVFEVSVGQGDGIAPIAALLEELDDGADAQAELLDGELEETRVADLLAQRLAATASHGGVVLLVDDLHRADAVLGSVLRSTMYAPGGERVRVVATAGDTGGAAPRALGTHAAFDIPPLSRAEVAELTADALGPVDEVLLDALVEQTEGCPAAVIDALAALFGRADAPTVADLHDVPQGVHLRALAERRRLQAPEALTPLLEALAIASASLPQSFVELLLGDEAEQLIGAGARCGLLRAGVHGVELVDPVVDRSLRAALSGERGDTLAHELLSKAAVEELAASTRARLAVRAGDFERARVLLPEATAELSRVGGHAAAIELNEALLPHVEGQERAGVGLALARAHHALGDHDASAHHAQQLIDGGWLDESGRATAAVLGARALTALARFDDAVTMLSTVPDDASDATRAGVARELAKVHMRRGDYAALDRSADVGLGCAAPDDVVRVELLCCKGVVAAYRSDAEGAREFHVKALELAQRIGARGDQAKALNYLGIGAWRAGDLVQAREYLSQNMEILLDTGDVGQMANAALNLGAILFLQGETASAAEHYERAAQLSRRVGSVATDLQARTNLAHVHVYFGLYERARVEVDEVLSAAARAGHRYLVAQGKAVLGDLRARTGDVDRALIHYDEAITIYDKLGQAREMAEHHLDAAEALLDRGGPADPSAAVARLSLARKHLADGGEEDELKLRLQLLLARTQLDNGDANGALSLLDGLLPRVVERRQRDLEWAVMAAQASAQEAGGAELLAQRTRRSAVEVLEDQALKLPREQRDAFWLDPRRRRVRDSVAVHTPEPTSDVSVFDRDGVQAALADPRMERLLEIIKRLAGEHDLERLLERITESAVDLSGAERGMVLLVDEGGNLEPHVTRAKGRGGVEPPDVAFSRSIAEAVLIDGEPIVTVDASHDGRLSEYVSVHKLMLRSVACLPIRGAGATGGVLYLEHRRSRGRFTEAVVDLLYAFADQAAIAIENARLMSENRARQEELQRVNSKLEQAARDLEDLVSAKSEQLDEAHRELARARRNTRQRLQRYDMIGASDGMRRLFDGMDRLRDADVPVVVCGESGSGKELVARGMHYGGKRSKAPFVAINCGALPEELLESELFGHVKGSFSGADRDRQGVISRASGGTLLLDEVGDMPPKMQVDLLRVLQEGTVRKLGGDFEEKVSVRVIAATQTPLQELVDQGRFRADLFYRLNVVELRLPPLRDRRQDIAPLADHFLSSFAERDGRPQKRISREALERLLSEPWPGNVRQLEHVLLQAWVMADGPTIEAADLQLDGDVGDAGDTADAGDALVVAALLPPAAPDEPLGAEARPQSVDEHRDAEKDRILAALESTGWNRAKAAKSLGMARRTFYRRLQDYQIL